MRPANETAAIRDARLVPLVYEVRPGDDVHVDHRESEIDGVLCVEGRPRSEHRAAAAQARHAGFRP